MKSINVDRVAVRSVKVHRAISTTIVVVCLFIAARLVPGGKVFPAPAAPQISSEARSERYLTHVSTDKPIYRSGEKLYVRGVILRADGHSPGAAGSANIEIKGPKGETVASGPPALSTALWAFRGRYLQVRPEANIPFVSSTLSRGMLLPSGSSISGHSVSLA
jgi:hypothetical protein